MKKKILLGMTFLFLCVVLAGCTRAPAPTPSGEYKFFAIELVPDVTQRLNIVGFEDHQNRFFEFRFGEEDFVTVSYIFFTDPMGDNTFHAHYTSRPTLFTQDGNRIILETGFEYVGEKDIQVYEGWVIFNYRINNQLVYTLMFRKTA